LIQSIELAGILTAVW